METFALTPEQGRQIVQHLSDLEHQLLECLVEWRQIQKKTYRVFLILQD